MMRIILGHTFTGEARYQAFDRLLAGLNGSYYLTRDPAQSDNLGNSIDRDKYDITRITPLLFYKFGDKFNVGLRYRHTDLDYDPGKQGRFQGESRHIQPDL